MTDPSPAKNNYIMKSALVNKSAESKLPIAKLVVISSVSTERIHFLFQDISTKLGFYIIDQSLDHSMAVHKPGCSLRRIFFCCPGLFGPEKMTAVKLLHEVDKRHNKKLITVAGLSGVLFRSV